MPATAVATAHLSIGRAAPSMDRSSPAGVAASGEEDIRAAAPGNMRFNERNTVRTVDGSTSPVTCSDWQAPMLCSVWETAPSVWIPRPALSKHCVFLHGDRVAITVSSNIAKAARSTALCLLDGEGGIGAVTGVSIRSAVPNTAPTIAGLTLRSGCDSWRRTMSHSGWVTVLSELIRRLVSLRCCGSIRVLHGAAIAFSNIVKAAPLMGHGFRVGAVVGGTLTKNRSET